MLSFLISCPIQLSQVPLLPAAAGRLLKTHQSQMTSPLANDLLRAEMHFHNTGPNLCSSVDSMEMMRQKPRPAAAMEHMP